MRVRFEAALLAALFALTADAKITRSREVIYEFKSIQPCPANSTHYGPCPGYDIDHKIPLKCGGADRPSNMQWLTKDEHKAKTKREAGWCRSVKH